MSYVGGQPWIELATIHNIRPEDMHHVAATVTELNELKDVVATLAAKVAELEAAIARGGTP